MCRALKQQGLDVTIAATDHGVDRGSFENKLQEGASPHYFQEIPAFLFPAQWGDSFKYSRPLASWLTGNVQNFDLVHIHAVFNHSCVAAARACRRHGVPYVVRPLGTLDPWSMKQKRLKKNVFWNLAARRMLAGAAAVHYTSQSEKEESERFLGIGRGVVVPLGVDSAVFDISIPALPGNNGLRETGDQPFVLILSRLHPKKGFDVFLKAFFSVCSQQKFANWRLVIAGEGSPDYVSELKKQVKAQDAHDMVSFAGWLCGDRKVAVLRRASLLALPSYHENFGICVIEAMASGVPVLVSPHVNLSEEVRRSKAGWVANVNEESLKRVLAEALEDRDERLRRGRAGKALSKNYSWERVGSSLINLYASLLLAEVTLAK
jgi:glycosyltransferase involved in cell wall biosynthesis